jgi:hypothetical protein
MELVNSSLNNYTSFENTLQIEFDFIFLSLLSSLQDIIRYNKYYNYVSQNYLFRKLPVNSSIWKTR